MTHVFLDSSVLVAASASTRGASAFILGCAKEKKIHAYVSQETIEEARKNVMLKLNERARQRFSRYLTFANLIEAPTPGAEYIKKCEQHINVKDASILAAALKSPASFLVTLDRKHFLTPEVSAFAKPLTIMLPGDFITKRLMHKK